MNNFYLILALSIFSCQNKQEVYAPIYQSDEVMIKKNSELEIEKNINKQEYDFLKNWMKLQKNDFFSSQNNYWCSLDLLKFNKRNEGESIAYEYDLLDLEYKSLYNNPIKKENLIIGKFDDIKAIENAVKYLPKKQKAYIVCPSIMAFGSVGDGNKILPHQPIIIKIEIL